MATRVMEKYALAANQYEDIFDAHLDRVWHDALTKKLRILPGMRILDLGCGTGRTVRRLVSAYEGHKLHVTGVDLCPEMIEVARRCAGQAAAEKGFTAEFAARDCLEHLKGVRPGTCDLVINTFLLAYVDARTLFALAHRALKQDGTLFIMTTSIDQVGAFQKALMTRFVTRHFWKVDWPELLFRKLTHLPPIDKVLRYLLEAQFANVEFELHTLPFVFDDPRSCVRWMEDTGFAAQHFNLVRNTAKDEVVRDLIGYADREGLSFLGEPVKGSAPFTLRMPFYMITASKQREAHPPVRAYGEARAGNA
jgi:ubiquinone/menaquinone biosynthesis C-methylase UbiE